MIEHLEDEVRDELESRRSGSTRSIASMELNGDRLEVLGRRSPDGSIHLGYRYQGVRMDRKTLLVLVCPEKSCPCRARVVSKWNQRLGIAASAAPHSRFQPVASPLFEEVEIRAHGRSCQARPALFRCLTPCPNNIHAAVQMQRSGWDLFEAGRYVAGGVIRHPQTGIATPVFPNLEVAKDWLGNSTHEGELAY